MSKNQQLTSVKLDAALFEEFKVTAIRTKMNFQKLAERSMWLYLHNKDFKELVHNTFDTELLK